ncbi:MAG: ATP synthase F1 subunit delta [Bdellovibrionales bacterium]
MKNMMLATRYARALYSLARESGEQDVVFDQMRTLDELFRNDKEIGEFLVSPMIRPGDKVKALEKSLASTRVAESLKKFLLLLARKNRLPLFPQTMVAFQIISDEAHGVTRGTVRSATVLGPEERKRIEQLVSRATKKQVILSYTEDSSLLGGLVAEVGSFTFDDSLKSHLNRINEQLTRSVH